MSNKTADPQLNIPTTKVLHRRLVLVPHYGQRRGYSPKNITVQEQWITLPRLSFLEAPEPAWVAQ